MKVVLPKSSQLVYNHEGNDLLHLIIEVGAPYVSLDTLKYVYINRVLFCLHLHCTPSLVYHVN